MSIGYTYVHDLSLQQRADVGANIKIMFICAILFDMRLLIQNNWKPNLLSERCFNSKVHKNIYSYI